MSAKDQHASPQPITQRRVFSLWWPLAGSWLLMGVEMPLLAVAMTRMPGGEVHLAAFGSLVYPLSVLIEAPIIMLLAASTELSRDLAAHRKLLRFTHVLSAVLTAVHAAVAFTPLFDIVTVGLMDAPAAVVEPGRIGMQIMTPWTWAIAYRRFQQGVLIRCGRSDVVVVGTGIRLVTSVSMLVVGLFIGTVEGAIVGGIAIASGVLAEAAWAGWCYRRHARPKLPATSDEPLTWRAFSAFYVPLAFTPIITIVIQPIGAWAMNNMARPVESLAAWPAVYGLIFITRSFGFVYNEVVVALAGRPGGVAALRAFGRRIALAAMAFLLLLVVTPAGEYWFGAVTGLSPPVTALSSTAVFIGLLMPGYAVVQNYHQGLLVFARKTRYVTLAVTAYMIVCWVCLAVAVNVVDDVPGIYIALGAFNVAGLVQTGLLVWWSRR